MTRSECRRRAEVNAPRRSRPTISIAEKNSGERLKFACMKTRMCVFHLQGVCAQGNTCTYAHNPEELRSTPNLVRTRLCEFHFRGNCAYGINCNYAHSIDELREEPGTPSAGPQGADMLAAAGAPPSAGAPCPPLRFQLEPLASFKESAGIGSPKDEGASSARASKASKGRRRRNNAKKNFEQGLEAFAMQIDTECSIGIDFGLGDDFPLQHRSVTEFSEASTALPCEGMSYAAEVEDICARFAEATFGVEAEDDASVHVPSDAGLRSDDSSELIDKRLDLDVPFAKEDPQGEFIHVSTGLKFSTKRTFIDFSLPDNAFAPTPSRRVQSIGPLPRRHAAGTGDLGE